MVEAYSLTKTWRKTREEVVKRDDHKCQHCNAEEPVASLEVHHIIPVRLSGSDELDNLVTLCQRCHNSLHYLGEDPEYPVEVLEKAGEKTNANQLGSRQMDSRYADNTPEGWTQEEWGKIIDDSDAPPKATLTTKPIDGKEYYYYQWHSGGKVKSEYLAPVEKS